MSETQWILYKTTNLINSKIYIGVHRLANTSYSKNYLGSGSAMKTAIKKYGRENFARETLAKFSCAEEAYKAESERVTEVFIKSTDNYNMQVGGMGGRSRIVSEETRVKIKNACKNREPVSEETRKKISIAGKGRKHSEETRRKIGEGNKGKVLSEETRRKLSDANKGTIVTEEVRAKISAFQKGRKRSQETKNKTTGARNHKSLAVRINGKCYESANIASKKEGIHITTLLYRVKNTKPRWIEWCFV